MKTIRTISAGLLTALAVLLLPAVAWAHVVVKPDQVGVGAFQTFTTSVPNEREVPVTGLRLVIPDDVQEVTPTVKSGWEITTKKTNDKVSEIDWTGGNIPVGMRDDFTFSAQAPADATTLQWKAYQTYQDGVVVSWDQASGSSKDEGGTTGPYSTTKVVNDLTDSSATATTGSQSHQTGAYVLSGTALALAIIALLTKRKESHDTDKTHL